MKLLFEFSGAAEKHESRALGGCCDMQGEPVPGAVPRTGLDSH